MSTVDTNKLNKMIDYDKTKLEDRFEITNNILEEGNYGGYFDNRYKVNLNSTDKLSEENPVCNSLERLANYLLNSDEVKEDKKTDEFEYKFYSDEESFNKAVQKEPKIDGMAQGVERENVIHFLKKENRNYKTSKNQKITKKDLKRDDVLGQVLRDYSDFLEVITKELNDFENSNLSRFQLSRISGQIKSDMILAKDMLLGVFGYKTNAEESCVIDWSQIDYTNHSHSRAMLYMKPGKRADEELMYIVDEFLELVKKSKPTKLQKDILELLRENKGLTDIGHELAITKQRVNKNIDMLVKRICKTAKQA